jgi:multiple sugar transport system substrate-binding protein
MHSRSTPRRRHAAIGLAAVLAVLAAACGSDDDGSSTTTEGAGSAAAGPDAATVAAAPDDETTIDILVPDTSAIIVDPAYEVLSADFTARTGTTVNFVKSGGDYGAVEQAILAGRIADDLPDAAIISSASITTYVSAGLAQPLDPLMAADPSWDLSAAEPSLLAFGERDGSTYALPLTASWLVMYYNAEIFEAAGLDPDDPPATFTELEAAARQIVESGAAPHGFAFRLADDPNLWRFQNVVRSGGGSFMSADGSELTLDDPAMLDVVEFLARNAEDGLLASLFDAPAIQEAFVKGDVAITYDASSGAKGYEERTPFDYRIAPYPVPDGGTRVLPAGGASIVMFTDDPVRQQGVWEAVRELVGPAGAQAYTSRQGGALVLDAATNAAKATEHAALALDTDDVDSFAPMFQFPGSAAQEVWKLLQDEVLAALQSGRDPADALSTADAEAEPLLS